MINRAYVRCVEHVYDQGSQFLLPYDPNAYAAARGFSQLGAEVIPFTDVTTEIEHLGSDTIVCGYISDVFWALDELKISRPQPIDYPEHLGWLFYRDIVRDTFDNVRTKKFTTQKVFVKPVKHKLFTGFVWDSNDYTCYVKSSGIPGDTECWVSDILDFSSEWRAFIKNDQVIGVKHYKGHFGHAPELHIIEKAALSGRGLMPSSYSLDVGVTRDDSYTVLVEANDGFALGCYGLDPILYARFLSTRWNQFFVSI